MEEQLANYFLCDGEVLSLQLGVEYSSADSSPLRQASIALLIRKKTTKGRSIPCLLQIQLTDVRRVCLNEDFGSMYYSDIVFKKIEDGLWYISLDPYSNSGEPHENDNLVLVAGSLSIEEGVIQSES